MPAVASRADHLALNQAFYEAFESNDLGLQKQAEGAVDAYTRLKIREEGVTRSVMPMIPISNSDLDRQVDTTLPVKVVDMEVNSPAAISVGLNVFPDQVYIDVHRYRVMFHRILSPWFQADIGTLRTNVIDIRQVLSDNSIKDIAAEEDNSFFKTVDSILAAGGGPNLAHPFSGVPQWVQNPSSISRNSLADMKKVMPSTPGRLFAARGVINMITALEFEKMGRDEMGGNISEQIFTSGWTETKFNNLDWTVTIKANIVPTNTAYLFADPAYLGKFFGLEETTMFIEKRAYFISFFAYEQIGMTLANPYGLVRYDFAA